MKTLLLSGLLLVLSPAYAQSPAATYPAGGAPDSVARLVGQKMSEEWGQPIVVENRAGADGNIGAELVAHSKPDGYTILMGEVGNLTLGPAVRRSVPYDAVRDFAPITQLV